MSKHPAYLDPDPSAADILLRKEPGFEEEDEEEENEEDNGEEDDDDNAEDDEGYSE